MTFKPGLSVRARLRIERSGLEPWVGDIAFCSWDLSHYDVLPYEIGTEVLAKPYSGKRSSPGSSPGRDIEFLNKTPYSHSASLHPNI